MAYYKFDYEANQIFIKDFLKKKGFSLEVTAGIMGNMQKESRSFSKQLTSDPFNCCASFGDFNGKESIGLIQWNGLSQEKKNKILSDKTGKVKCDRTEGRQGWGPQNQVGIAEVQSEFLLEWPDFKNWVSQIPTLLNKVRNGFHKNLMAKKSDAWIHAYTFAHVVEVCFACVNWRKDASGNFIRDANKNKIKIPIDEQVLEYEKGRTTEKGTLIIPGDRSNFADTFLLRMKNPNDILYWENTTTNSILLNPNRAEIERLRSESTQIKKPDPNAWNVKSDPSYNNDEWFKKRRQNNRRR